MLHDEEPIKFTLKNVGEKKYELNFKSEKDGFYQVNVFLNGVKIKDSKLSMKLKTNANSKLSPITEKEDTYYTKVGFPFIIKCNEKDYLNFIRIFNLKNSLFFSVGIGKVSEIEHLTATLNCESGDKEKLEIKAISEKKAQIEFLPIQEGDYSVDVSNPHGPLKGFPIKINAVRTDFTDINNFSLIKVNDLSHFKIFSSKPASDIMIRVTSKLIKLLQLI